MSQINQAYAILSDPKRRKEHDNWIAQEEAKLRATASADTNKTSNPPNWQPSRPSQSTPPPPHPRTKNHNRNIFVIAILLPFRIWSALFNFAPGFAILLLFFCSIILYQAIFPQPHSTPEPNSYSPAPDIPLSRPTYSRPPLAPNGEPWPNSSGYIAGYPQLASSGLSNITIDNLQSNADFYIKLVSLDRNKAYPVRQFLVLAKSQFTINHVAAGSYEIRYRNLLTGSTERSQSFQVTQSDVADGIEYSSITLTMYRVQGGTFQSYPLPEWEF